MHYVYSEEPFSLMSVFQTTSFIYIKIYNIVNVELFVLNLIVFIDNIHLSTCLSRYDVYVEFAQEMTTLSIIIIIKK